MPLSLQVPSTTESTLVSERAQNIKHFLELNETDNRIVFIEGAKHADIIVLFEKLSNQNTFYMDTQLSRAR
jgi:hypothetical protein